MITAPKVEHRDAQPYAGIQAQVTMQELGKVLPPLRVKCLAGWQAMAQSQPVRRCGVTASLIWRRSWKLT
jgi:hypothetical protein